MLGEYTHTLIYTLVTLTAISQVSLSQHVALDPDNDG